jgi:hypothetical protein
MEIQALELALLEQKAVLTGDLIGSTKAGPEAVDEAMEALAEAAKTISKWAGAEDVRFTRYRGDGWQILLPDPSLALRAALFLNASLKARRTGLLTRIAIGCGPVDRPGTTDLKDASGEAFTLSGRALDAMPKGRTLAFEQANASPRDMLFIKMTDALIRKWSPEQAEAMAMALGPWKTTYEMIARQLGITIQAVSQRLKNADHEAILDLVEGAEAQDIWRPSP